MCFCCQWGTFPLCKCAHSGQPTEFHDQGHVPEQSRRLDVRLRMPKTPEGETVKEFVHMLNGTLTATERTICCLLENHQTPDGVRCAFHSSSFSSDCHRYAPAADCS